MIFPINPALQLLQNGRSIEAQVLRPDGRVWLSSPLFSTYYGQRLQCTAETSSIAEAECIAAEAAREIRAMQAT